MELENDTLTQLLIKDSLEELPGVREVHDIHLWSLDGTNHVFTCHLIIGPEESLPRALELIRQAREKLKEMGITHSTFELEPEDAECRPC